MTEEITKAFSDLEASLKQLETLQAWRDLERAESRSCWPLLPWSGSGLTDLKAELGRFWQIIVEVSSGIDRLATEERDAARKRLARLMRQARNIEASVWAEGY